MRIALISSLLLLTPVGHAQVLHADGPLPSFEVVSIKPFQPKPLPPAPPGEQIVHQQVMKFAPKPPVAQASDRVRFIMNTRTLIAAAFNLPLGSEGRVVGGPDWVNTQQYTVNAKIDEGSFAEMQKMSAQEQRRQVNLMEQSLLADRFHLKVHFEKRPHDAYDLVVAKGGSKLTPATESERMTITMAGDRMTVQSATIADWDPFDFHEPVQHRGQDRPERAL
jgi:uncharacterized protein (TIGR03435 family)